MKTLKLTLVMVLAFVSLTLSAQTKHAVNTSKSNLEWVGKKVTGQHNGDVKLKNGSLTTNGDKITAGEFTIDMTTLQVLDLKGDMNGKLLGHLQSDDFFSVEKHNTATFVLKSATAKKGENGANYEITGDLTIKGITNSITFPAKIVLSKAGFVANADFTIDRTKWDVKYGSGSFFDGLGDKTIYDDIEFSLYLTSVK